MSQSRDTGYALEITGIAHHREIPRKALAFKGGSLRSLRALMNARRRNRALSSGPFHTDVEHPRRGHGTTFIEQEHEAAPSADNAEFQGALLIDRSVQSGRHRRRAVCRVAGNPDRMAAETLDAVMAALGLNVNCLSELGEISFVVRSRWARFKGASQRISAGYLIAVGACAHRLPRPATTRQDLASSE